MTLAGAGVPVDTVTLTGKASASVSYQSWATDAQRSLGKSLLDEYDWTDDAEKIWQDAQNPDLSTLRNATDQAVADINTYLALPSPTNAQVVAMVSRLCVNVRAITKRLVQIQG